MQRARRESEMSLAALPYLALIVIMAINGRTSYEPSRCVTFGSHWHHGDYWTNVS